MVHRIRHQHEVARGLFILLFVLLCAAPPARAQNLPFKAGETLLFSARWLFFDAGMVEASVADGAQLDGCQGLRFVLHTWSANTIAKIFTMDDRFESLWNPMSRLPASTKMVIRESTTTKDKMLEFDHSRGTIRVMVDNKPPETFPLNPGAQDFFSASYLIRATRLKPKQRLQVPVFEDNKNYHADIYVAKRERIPVLGGEVDTVMIIARLKFEGAFTGSNLLYIWLTDDEYQVPVRLELDVAFGQVVLDLVKAEGVSLNVIRDTTAPGAIAVKQ